MLFKNILYQRTILTNTLNYSITPEDQASVTVYNKPPIHFLFNLAHQIFKKQRPKHVTNYPISPVAMLLKIDQKYFHAIEDNQSMTILC